MRAFHMVSKTILSALGIGDLIALGGVLVNKITLYEHISYGGRSQDFTESCPDLDEYDFDDITSSAKCNRGVWILYSEKYYQGNIFVVQDGEDYNDNLCDNFNDYASSIRLLDNFPSGEMKILKIDYDLDKKQTSRTPSTVFSWTQVNNTSVEQTLSEAEEITILRENTYEFKWNRGTKVPATMTANVGIPLIGKKEVSVSPDMSVSVGSALGTKTTKREKWVAKYPSKIPSYSTYV
ncbi:epidermal differentiation-specific protein-like [Mytilus edulis]|uniref:epidermal differentiation-specific protein-like n=1 Tax=Mytilus edulis TaxID=6550 RepID=UPI0039EFA381